MITNKKMDGCAKQKETKYSYKYQLEKKAKKDPSYEKYLNKRSQKSHKLNKEQKVNGNKLKSQ